MFEILCWLGWLPIQTYYTEFGLVIMNVFIWCVFEWKRPAPWAALPGVICIYFDAIGDYTHWYATYQYYDVWMHGLGGASTALFIYYWYSQTLLGKLPRSVVLWLALATAMAFGSLYEIEEYLEDVITGSYRLGDGFDTANDMFMNTTGAILVLLLAWLLYKHRQKSRQ